MDMNSCNGEDRAPAPGGLYGGGGNVADVVMSPADPDPRDVTPADSNNKSGQGPNAGLQPVAGSSGQGHHDGGGAGSAKEGEGLALMESDNGDGCMNGDKVMRGVDPMCMTILHPLELYNVVKEVLKFLSSKELETVRMVSQTWNTEASGLLRKREQTIVFLYPGSVDVYNDSMRGTRTYPHARFEFCLDNMSKFSEGAGEPGLAQFWEVFGPAIMALDLRQENIFWVDLVEILERVPNLEKLELRFLPRQLYCTPIVRTELIQNQSVKVVQLSSFPWDLDGDARFTEVLKAFPVLQEIDFLPFKRDEIQDRVRAVVAHALVHPEVSLPHLKKIGINLELDQELLSGLVNKAFPFQSLHIELTEDVEAASFKNLILTLVPTLLELKISFPHSFVRKADHLRTREHPQGWIVLLSNLQSLHMDNFQWPTKFLRMLSTCYPFLTCLHVNGVKDDHLGVIYRSLPNLTDLGLFQAKCSDQGITGVALRVCQDLLDTHRIFEDEAVKYRSDLYIGCLPLKKLAIFGDQITNASIALGLVDLNNLKELRIGSNKISDQGIIGVADRFWNKLDLLDICACPNVSDEGKAYVNEIMCGEVKTFDPENDVDGEALRLRRRPPPPSPLVGSYEQTRRRDRVIVTPTGGNLPEMPESLLTHEEYFFEEVADETRARVRALEDNRILFRQAFRRNLIMPVVIQMMI